MQEDKSGTLGTGNDQTIFCYGISAYESNAMKSSNPKSGVYVADTSRTLDLNGGNPACNQGGMAVVCPTILDMSNACDVIRDCGDVAPGLKARMGTGGNQLSLTYQMQGFGDYRAGEVASSCKQRDFKDGTDLSITNMGVRRLTPMECERLQGFPDGWTDIGEWIDDEGRTHKQADSPRYKALGNSIALPFWYWMFCRMAEHLPEKATLGSLFDGISGFNVCWARVHGSECCRWSSEIEQFPIAVTKKHFGDEEAGKEGDFEKFFGRNKKENV